MVISNNTICSGVMGIRKLFVHLYSLYRNPGCWNIKVSYLDGTFGASPTHWHPVIELQARTIELPLLVSFGLALFLLFFSFGLKLRLRASVFDVHSPPSI